VAHGDEIQRNTGAAVRHHVILWAVLGGVNRATDGRG
jgi:hypothetical protein